MRGLETDRYEKCFIPSDTKIEDNSRAFKLQKANFDSEVNTAVRSYKREDWFDFLSQLF